MWYLIFALVFLIVAGFLVKIKVKLCLHIAPGQSNIRISVFTFFRLIRIPIHLRILHTHGEKLCVMLIRHNGNNKIIFPLTQPEKLFLSEAIKGIPITFFLNTINLKLLSQRLRIGADDPKLTVSLCSLADNLFTIISSSLFFDDAPNIVSQSTPDFSRRIIILNVEGIMHINHVKIILKVISNIMNNMTRKEISE